MSKRTESSSTQLAVVPSEAYLALQSEAEELRALVDEYLQDGLTEGDLHTITIPGAGGKSWDLPSDQSAPTFQGVILGVQTNRAYWTEAFSGSGQPPACSSRDGVTGVGNPGGSCQQCPLARWGSGREGIGSACSARKIVYVLRPEDTLPIRLSLPVTSFKNLRRYQLDLLNKRVRLSAASTEFGLLQAQSKKGIKYSQATFALAGALDKETATRASAYAALLAASLSGKMAMEEEELTAGRNPALNEDELPFALPPALGGNDEEMPF